MKSWSLLLSYLLLFVGCSSSATKDRGASVDPELARKAELEAAELSPEKQKIIWDAEHVTFELEWRFGPHFKRSLKGRNAERLAQTMREGFIGHWAQDELDRRKEQRSGVVENRFVAAAEPIDLDAASFADALLLPTQSWSEVSSVSLRVLNIDRLDGDDKRWETRLLLTQDGLQDGRRVRDSSEHIVHWTIESDKHLEDQPVIDRWDIEKRSTLAGEDRTLFEEVTKTAWLEQLDIPDNWNVRPEETEQYRFGVAVEDFNRDGFLDIAVAIYGGERYLLEGSPELVFRDVTRKLGLHREPLGNYLAAWIDFDDDGFPDLLLGDRLYKNVKGRFFDDITEEAGLHVRPECMGATVADYDCDGQLDLYMLYQRDWESPTQAKSEKWVDESDTGRENELWRNVDGKFRNVAIESRAGGGKSHTHSAAWFFYDDDHFPDLYVANDFGKNTLLRNTGNGVFEDVSSASATGGFSTSMGVATGDLNNDGTNEIYVANMFSKMGRRIIANVEASDYPEGIYDQILGSCAGNQLYIRPGPNETFQERGLECGVNQVGWAFAPALADFNNDGLLDIYATTGFMSFARNKPDG